MTRRIGFTGTREGMTGPQRATVAKLLAGWRDEFHHGDCLGADAEAHTLAVAAKFRTVCHPPTDDPLRAYTVNDETLPALPYLARNRAIVDATDELVAAPATAAERKRSGTWATVRYAVKVGRPVTVVAPDGSTTRVTRATVANR